LHKDFCDNNKVSVTHANQSNSWFHQIHCCRLTLNNNAHYFNALVIVDIGLVLSPDAVVNAVKENVLEDDRQPSSVAVVHAGQL